MYRVLLVDDEILVRDAIRENIDWNGLGYELAGDCQNGKEAIEFVREHPVDVVLTDICMPYVDGMELSHFLHDHYPEVLIIIFSGFGEFEYAKKAIQYKVSEYLLKPVTAMELTEVLGRMKEKLEAVRLEEKKLEHLTRTSEEYKKNAQVIRSQAISSLVGCTRDISQCQKELEEMGIILDATDYRVAVVGIDLYSELYEQNAVQRQESALMAFVVYNVSDEIVHSFDAGVAYQETSNRICILFQTNKPKEFCQTVSRICREIQEKIYETMKLEVSIAVGPYVKCPEDLHLSYHKADDALEYRYLLGGNLVLDLEGEGAFEKEISLYEPLARLPEAVRKNSRQEIEDILEEIRRLVTEARVNRNRACLYLQQVVRALSQEAEKVHQNPRIALEKREQILTRITEQRTFVNAMNIVYQYAREVGDYMEMENSSSGKRQAFQALDYIREHYADPDLSLNGLCSYLGISTSYFSTIFKEVTGETFMDVLIRTRMERAKELLETTALKNYEIAERVGFSDPHYFGISFKKMTGKTPTEYARERRG